MKINKYIMILGITGLFLTSCDDVNIDDPVNPNYKPKATIITDNTLETTNEVDELVIVYNITIDKAIEQPINFVVIQTGGTADSDDYEITNGTIAPYTNSTQIIVKILNDNNPENDEDLMLKIVPQSSDNSNGWSAENNYFLLSPDSQFSELNITIENKVPENFTVQLGWDSDLASDLDVFVFDPDGNDYSVQGTGDNPELSEMIAADAPDGVYQIGIDPYAVEDGTTNFDLNWAFASPDGEVAFLSQNFDYTNRDDVYTSKVFAAWATNTYLMLEVTKTGDTFVVTTL